MDKATKSKAAKSINAGLEIPYADAQFFLACLQCMGDDKQIDLTKVGDMMGYSNVASVGNRFRAIRKRYNLNNIEAKSGSGVLKSAGANGDKDKGAAGATEAGDGVEEQSDDSDVPTPVKPKGRKVAARKGAKATTSKPIPATGTLKSETKDRKRGAKSAVVVKEEEEDDADSLMEDNTPDDGMECATA